MAAHITADAPVGAPVQGGIGLPGTLLALQNVIHAGKDLGNVDLSVAAVHAVLTSRAGDPVLSLPNGTDPLHHLLLGVSQGLEILHERHIFRHLLHIAHAGEHHGHIGPGGRKPDGKLRGTDLLQFFHGLFRQVHQGAALHRLHDEHRLAVLAADLIAFAALDLGIVPVRIVQLQLHHFDLGPLAEDLVQHPGTVVEGHTHMADLALGFQLLNDVISPGIGEFLMADGGIGMEEIEVKVVNAAFFQLVLKQGPDFFLRLELGGRQLVGQHILLPGIPGGEAGFHHTLTGAGMIGSGGVKIVEALCHEMVHHFGNGSHVHFFPHRGEAHTAEAEILFDLREELVHNVPSGFSVLFYHNGKQEESKGF